MIAVSRARRIPHILLALLVVATALLLHASVASAQTVVSLTFDDGLADQYTTGATLASHGMRGTYYVNSLHLSGSDNMTLGQVQALQSAGHEIGGHTAEHLDVTTLTHDQLVDQVCGDRSRLVDAGLRITSFAYPYGSYDNASRDVVSNCGYNSARGVSGIKTPRDCTDCDVAESIPPANPYVVRTGDSSATTSLAEFEGYVTQAEAAAQSTGRDQWVVLVFHHVCNCPSEAYNITPANLTALLNWLQPRSASGTVVKTVDQVVGGTVMPAVSEPPTPVPGGGTNLVPNPSLETSTLGDAPDCWAQSGYGDVVAETHRTDDAHTGLWAERLDVTTPAGGLYSGDAKFWAADDEDPACTIPVRAGAAYHVTAWMKSTTAASLFAFYRDANGDLQYFGEYGVATTPDWTLVSFDTQAVPAGATQLAIGVLASTVGSVTVDDFAVGYADQTSPFVALTAPTNGASAAGTVNFTAYANDASGIDRVEFVVDDGSGGDAAQQVVGSATSSPYTFAWDSRSIHTGTVTVFARAVDVYGNAAVTGSRTLHINNDATDVTPPTAVVTCDGGDCAGAHRSPTLVQLSASDDYSGVTAIRYTTDGSTPTALVGSTYSAPLSLTATTTLKWFSYDARGNAEAVHTQVIDIDSVAPVTTAVCTSGTCLNGATIAAQSLVLSATDDDSGVSQIRYTTDGSDPVAHNGLVYTGPIAITGNVTIRFLAIDLAGNFEAIHTITFQVDTTAPVTTATCNGAACGSSAYGSTVTVELGAADDDGGSGLARVRYTTDGSDPTAAHGTTYRTPLHLSRASTLKYRAYDNVGNVEDVRTLSLVLDTAAPTSAVTSPAAGATLVHGQATTATATAVDAGVGVQEVRFYLDGHLVGSDDSAPYSVTFAPTAAMVGSPRNVYVVATDALGHARQSRYVKVRVS
jgi:peptidoglycan/xylan/chitin deacetylase (PgdA/CDA1 family)